MKDLKIIAIIILAIALAIVSYVAFEKDKSTYDKELLELQMHKIDSINVRLLQDNAAEREKAIKFEKLSDSLQSVKPQTQIKYIHVYKKIDSDNANGVVNEFKNVLPTGSTN